MKIATCLMLILLLACGSALAEIHSKALAPQAPDEKPYIPGDVPNPVPQVGGEDIATAVNIPLLPYTDSGNTCAYLDNYEESCFFSTSTAPDVVYKYSPTSDVTVNIDLCDSYYDTKVFVYENAHTPGFPYACNDDDCSGPNYPSPYLSRLEGLDLVAGNTYYIVVDGYGGLCGEYVLKVSEYIPPPPCGVCPPGSMVEGEPDCGPNYEDNYNGGCNSTPWIFQELPCTSGALTMCGRYGTFDYFGSSYRDTDWYQINVPAGGFANVTACLQGEENNILGYIDGNTMCTTSTFDQYVLLDVCEYGCLSLNLPEGPAWIWVGTYIATGGCDWDYVLYLDGLECPVPVERTSWGEIKAQYK